MLRPLTIAIISVIAITIGGFVFLPEYIPQPAKRITVNAVDGASDLFLPNQEKNKEIAEAPPLNMQATVSPLTAKAECVASEPLPESDVVEEVDGEDDEDDDDDEDEDDYDDDEEYERRKLGCAACDKSGDSEKKNEEPDLDDIWGLERWSLKLRAGGFIPSSGRFRYAYRAVGPNVEVESAIKFARDPFELWANVNSFWQRGAHRKEFSCKRVGNMVNISFGMKFSTRIQGCMEPYIGFGPSFGWLDIWFDNSRSCKNETFNRWALGAVVKSGVMFYITPTVFLDVYLDYIYQPVHWRDIDIDVGGLRSGIGLGVAF
jgi:hypothetical protein